VKQRRYGPFRMGTKFELDSTNDDIYLITNFKFHFDHTGIINGVLQFTIDIDRPVTLLQFFDFESDSLDIARPRLQSGNHCFCVNIPLTTELILSICESSTINVRLRRHC
jgi:hypothetical protein